MKKKTFKGLEIPEGLTLEKCEVAIAYGKSGKSGNLCGGLHARGERAGCGNIVCRDCILRQENLNTLIEYASSLRELEGGRRGSIFMGFEVPGMCYDMEKLKNAAARFNNSRVPTVWCHGIASGCIGISCTECLLCDNAANVPEERKRKAFAEYLHRKGIPVTRPGYETSVGGDMPELKPGMLIQKDTGEYILVVSSKWGYQVALEKGSVVIETQRDVPSESLIVKVWYWADDPSVALHTGQIQDILRPDGRLPYAVRCWVRPKPAAKKMTVDEVSRALGYTVEIVGDEKADDRL